MVPFSSSSRVRAAPARRPSDKIGLREVSRMAAYRVAALSLCLVLAMTTAEKRIVYPETRKARPGRRLPRHQGRRPLPLARGRRQRRDRRPGSRPRTRSPSATSTRSRARERIQERADRAVELRALRRAVARRAAATSITSNDGLQNQASSTSTKSLDGDAATCCSIRTRCRRTAPSRSAASHVSDDGKLPGLRAVAEAGSDWHEWQVRDVATGKDLPTTS